MRGFQNFDQRTFSTDPVNNFYNFLDYDNIYYGGSGIFPCGSVGGTAGYMATKNLLKDE
jgi:phytoene dehydrogenase-like protein